MLEPLQVVTAVVVSIAMALSVKVNDRLTLDFDQDEMKRHKVTMKGETMATHVNPIPDGFHTVTPVLTVQGAAKLIDFLKQAFDAKEIYRLDGPNETVIHAEVKIGDSMVMVGETTDQWKPMPATVALYVKDTDGWYQRALKAGASSVREPSDQFYGDRSAGVKDFAGNHWWIHTHIEDVPQGEIKKRAEAWMKQQKNS